MSDEALEYEPIEEVLLAYPALVLAIVSVLLTSVHSFKFYQDFYTKERLSVQHRRHQPHMDTTYKRASHVTLVTVMFCTMFLVFQAIQYNFMTTNCGAGAVTILTGLGLYGAKGGLYCTYVFRLHQVYRQSVYRYSTTKLVAVASIAVVVSMALFVFLTFGSFAAPVIYDDTDGTFPWFCQILMKDPYQAMVGGVMVLFDVTASVLSIVGFTYPLKKVLQSEKDDPKAKDRIKKVVTAGYKYKVLVIAASSTTILWIFLVLFGLQSAGFIVMLLDYVINPVCLLLMTPYYPSTIYYERLCFLCICCFGRMEERNTDEKGEPSARSRVKSVSTNGPNESGVQLDVGVVNPDDSGVTLESTKKEEEK
eukprot:60928_1